MKHLPVIAAATAAIVLPLIGVTSAYASEGVASSTLPSSTGSPASSSTATTTSTPAGTSTPATTVSAPTTVPASTEPTTAPSPSSSGVPAPTTTAGTPSSASASPSPHPTSTSPVTPPTREPVVIVTVAWLLPDGGTADHVTWPQTLYTADVCGTGTIQHDVYRGTQAQIDAILEDGILNQGEDYGIAQSWSFTVQTPCVVIPPKPTVTPTQVETRGTPDCIAGTVTITLTTTTPTFVYKEAKNTWVEGEPVVDTAVTYVDATTTECPLPPVVTPPTIQPTVPVVTPTRHVADRVTSTSAPVAAQSLAYTGSDAAPWVAAGLILLLAGLVALFAKRVLNGRR